MRLVVTGAKGFIGSVLSVRAAERGHEVLAVDDESRGLNDVGSRPGVQYVRHDCSGGLMEVVPGGAAWRAEAVVHLAAATGSLDRPLEELRFLNVGMLQRVYQDAIALGARAFVWPTTSLALGVPDSPYVMSKEEGLQWLLEADRERRITIPCRFFNVAGAYKGLSEFRKNEVHLIPEMVSCWKERRPLIVNGGDYPTFDGTPSRDFVNVLDVVEDLLDLTERRLAALAPPVAPDGAVWLGIGEPLTVLEAVGVFRQYVGPLQAEVGPRRAYDCAGLRVADDQARRFIGWRRGVIPARISIRDEVRTLLDGDRGQASWVP
jgi:UDP-glucose 4-epimerase